MEPEKIIRIVTYLLLFAAFAIQVATRLMFTDASHTGNIPLTIMLLLALAAIRRPRKNESSNE